jgi:hypothetical protein
MQLRVYDDQQTIHQPALAGQKPAAQPSQSESETSNDAVKVYLYGNTAVVTVLSTWRGKENNQEYSS